VRYFPVVPYLPGRFPPAWLEFDGCTLMIESLDSNPEAFYRGD